ncbi:hypothetical protein ACWKSP_05655 [Micromonosporaceae bacterium Da 78-11]
MRILPFAVALTVAFALVTEGYTAGSPTARTPSVPASASPAAPTTTPSWAPSVPAAPVAPSPSVPTPPPTAEKATVVALQQIFTPASRSRR